MFTKFTEWAPGRTVYCTVEYGPGWSASTARTPCRTLVPTTVTWNTHVMLKSKKKKIDIFYYLILKISKIISPQKYSAHKAHSRIAVYYHSRRLLEYSLVWWIPLKINHNFLKMIKKSECNREIYILDTF